MNRIDIAKRARVLTRDLKNTLFREEDVLDFINESIDRVISLIPQCRKMTYLLNSTDEPSYLPSQYHYLLAIYCASRLYTQDDNDTKAVMFMNEFEAKIDELNSKIDSGKITIFAPNGVVIPNTPVVDYVLDNYFTENCYTSESETPNTDEEIIYDAGEF